MKIETLIKISISALILCWGALIVAQLNLKTKAPTIIMTKDKLNDVAMMCYKKYGINPAIPLIQIGIETAWTKQVIELRAEPNFTYTKFPSNNYFNIKASSDWKGRIGYAWVWEVVNGENKFMWQKFRAYDSALASVEDWIALVRAKPYYQDAWNNRDDVIKFFKGLQEENGDPNTPWKYATDPQYIKTATSLSKYFEFIPDKEEVMSTISNGSTTNI